MAPRLFAVGLLLVGKRYFLHDNLARLRVEAADHEKAGLADAYWPVKVEVLREAEQQIRSLPKDLP